ncbi:MAG TPA: hypothetical protein VL547_14395 [Dinghuibacter sp.]|uniref:hypothetical protein n=1 Tax=Dinghuibacter sp. TaxID=2024697 RepID=UPI002C9BC91D|nr:hypothetical protein [Dinghuibacter sp.]HTJ13221.1 hypothetical protein [Dinghuibacter sp.]
MKKTGPGESSLANSANNGRSQDNTPRIRRVDSPRSIVRFIILPGKFNMITEDTYPLEPRLRG